MALPWSIFLGGGMHLYVLMCTMVCLPVWAHVEAGGWHQMSSQSLLHLAHWDRVSHWTRNLLFWAGLASRWAPAISCLLPQCQGYTCHDPGSPFYMDVRGSNGTLILCHGCFACWAASPAPLNLLFKTLYFCVYVTVHVWRSVREQLLGLILSFHPVSPRDGLRSSSVDNKYRFTGLIYLLFKNVFLCICEINNMTLYDVYKQQNGWYGEANEHVQLLWFYKFSLCISSYAGLYDCI